ncbi:MAG TPA: exodeoxyribonuclease VII small subunit [Clostridiaceae bacterium]|nr:exodeoxyribonuclease VII small subunit [Clostridiaceae bacterium]
MSDIEKSFEEALSDLEKIVEELENGELTLEQSLERFQKGIELSKYCNKRLDEVERKISILIENEEGKLVEEVLKDA